MGRRIASIIISLLVCVPLLLSVPGAARAMPLLTPVSYPAGNNPAFVAVGDFNADGKPDLAVSNMGGSNISILIGRGDGTFNAPVNYVVGISPNVIAVGDFNCDGKPDLAVENFGSASISILIGRGDGTFNAAVNYETLIGPSHVAVGDFNCDGKPDLAVTNQAITYVSVLLNGGDGTFNTRIDHWTGTLFPAGAAVYDFNSDGKPDLAAVDASGASVQVFLGRGDGNLDAPAAYAIGHQAYRIALGDFNGDGIMDVAAACWNCLTILLGWGNGTFRTAANYPVVIGTYQDISAGDFNGDGKPDVAISLPTDNLICIMINKGDGTFGEGVYYSVENFPNCVAVGDFNCDGAIDLAVPRVYNNSVAILLNTSPVPALTGVTPRTGTQGQSITVVINGTNLLSASAVSFGSYIMVNGFTVNSGTRITASITIGSNATPGARDISVTTLGGTATLDNAFSVNQAAVGTAINQGAAPRGSSVPSVQQGPVGLSNIRVKTASISTDHVAPGSPVTVTAEVANTGTGNGASVVTVYVNGAEEARQGVSINSGDTSQVSFDVVRNDPGTYTVYVGGVQTGSFTVDQFTPDTILIISGALVLFALAGGVAWMARKRQTGY